MNKKEEKMVNDLRNELNMLRAMRITGHVEPDLDPATYGEENKQGFLFYVSGALNWNIIAYDTGVMPLKNCGWAREDVTPLYSTRLKALQAARSVMSIRYARALSEIDAKIASEEKETK